MVEALTSPATTDPHKVETLHAPFVRRPRDSALRASLWRDALRPDTSTPPRCATQGKGVLRGPGCTEQRGFALRRKLGWNPLARSEHRGMSHQQSRAWRIAHYSRITSE